MAIIGAILGDISGSQYEFYRPKNLNYKKCELFTDKCYFTDDTVMTLAVKLAVKNNIPFADSYRILGRKYPNAGYGGMFDSWLRLNNEGAYNSFGNGSAMTSAYTTVVTDIYSGWCGVFFDERLAYKIKNPNQKFYEDVHNGEMEPVFKKGVYVRGEN